jgi:predicted metal-binding membrane protein
MFKSNRNLFNPQTLVIGSALIVIAGLAWVYVVRQAGHMQSMSMQMPEMGMMAATGPTLAGAVVYLFAWGVMMAAMMLPSATPMIALYGTIHKKRTSDGAAAAPVALFTLVYLLAWLAFGIPVYLFLQSHSRGQG